MNKIDKNKFYVRNWIAFWILGTVNNFSYVVVNSAGQSLVDSFDKGNLIGLILWANIAFGTFSRIANAFFLEGVSYNLRIILIGVFTTLSLVGIALSIYVGFWFCILSIVIGGVVSSLGESVLLGYMKVFPPEIVSGWSSGTGMAGVAGSLFYLFFDGVLGLSDLTIFLMLSPLGIVYCGVFLWMLKHPPSSKDPSLEMMGLSLVNTERAYLVENVVEENQSEITAENGKVNEISDHSELIVVPENETNMQRYLRCLKAVSWLGLNMGLVYFFEYVASVGGSDKAQPKDSKNSSNWWVRNAYVVLAFCYQLGVLLSRSSLSLFKIKRVEIITLLQGINMVFWLLQAKFKLIEGNVGVWFQFLLMIYVGLLGGASYVNIFYLILHDRRLNDKDREMSVNWAAILVNVGVTTASVFILIMDHTFLKND